MNMNNNFKFPRNFVWGVAAAAAQIEGAAFEDGKGESVWDRYAHTGRVDGDHNLDIACDHYHRFREDFALMQELGVKNYRLSMAWPRIFSQGDGTANQKGIDFYHRLIDAMLEHGITPWVTMFHWDTPQALEECGGWRSRKTPEAFAAYADTVVKCYGDRVKNWITLNEIRCFTEYSYSGDLRKAPDIPEEAQVVNQTIHHALVAHGYGVRAVREHGGKGARVGLTDNCLVTAPLTNTAADIAAAKAVFADLNLNILDAIYRGKYSPAFLRRCGADRPLVQKGDFDLISLPTDYLGLNIYTGEFVRAGKDRKPETLPFPEDYPETSLSWLKIMPQSIYWATRFCSELYPVKAIYITENGCGYQESPDEHGEVLDLHRVQYLRSYLEHLHRACADGVPVKGYFCWSFMDNFEWADGYDMRFGLVYTDYATQQRIPKLSAHWYSSVMRNNGVL